MNNNIGVSSEEFASNISKFSQAVRETVEAFLTSDEIKELNNPRTSKRRIKRLIDISTERMMQGEIDRKSVV